MTGGVRAYINIRNEQRPVNFIKIQIKSKFYRTLETKE